MIRFKCEKNNEVDGEDNSSGGHGGDAAFALKVCVVWQEVKVGDEHLCVFVYVSGWGTGAEQGGSGGGRRWHVHTRSVLFSSKRK